MRPHSLTSPSCGTLSTKPDSKPKGRPVLLNVHAAEKVEGDVAVKIRWRPGPRRLMRLFQAFGGFDGSKGLPPACLTIVSLSLSPVAHGAALGPCPKTRALATLTEALVTFGGVRAVSSSPARRPRCFPVLGENAGHHPASSCRRPPVLITGGPYAVRV